VHEIVTAGLAVVISRNLSGKNVPELGKGVVQNLVADRLVKVLDETVACHYQTSSEIGL
jgi:hypothetical protein